MAEDLDSRIKSALPHVPEDVVFNHRQAFVPEHPIRRILLSEIQRKIDESRNGLESCDSDALKELQGQIKACKHIIGIINSIGIKHSQKLT